MEVHVGRKMSNAVRADLKWILICQPHSSCEIQFNQHENSQSGNRLKFAAGKWPPCFLLPARTTQEYNGTNGTRQQMPYGFKRNRRGKKNPKTTNY